MKRREGKERNGKGNEGKEKVIIIRKIKQDGSQREGGGRKDGKANTRKKKKGGS